MCEGEAVNALAPGVTAPTGTARQRSQGPLLESLNRLGARVERMEQSSARIDILAERCRRLWRNADSEQWEARLCAIEAALLTDSQVKADGLVQWRGQADAACQACIEHISEGCSSEGPPAEVPCPELDTGLAGGSSPLVVNNASKVVHLLVPSGLIPAGAEGRTFCGWRYGATGSRASSAQAIPLDHKHICDKCFPSLRQRVKQRWQAQAAEAWSASSPA